MKGFGEQMLVIPLLSMLIAQVIKVVRHKWKQRIWNWGLIFETGGMPSSHSALVCSLAVELGLRFGWNSPWFAVATVLALVVMYDAIGVRRQAGEHSMIIRELVQQAQESGMEMENSPIIQLRHWHKKGHTPSEVFWGMILGIVIASLSYVIFQ